MIVTCEAIQRAERRLFEEGVAAGPLMEQAGLGCVGAIRQWFRHPSRAILFVGKGNNGGDALVIGRELRRLGWKVEARYAAPPGEMSELARAQRLVFERTPEPEEGPGRERPDLVLVDGLLGIGARGPLQGRLRNLAAEMNALRVAQQATTVAVDLPSGVDGDTGEPGIGAVVADITLTITAAKAGLIADRSLDHVGRLAVVEIPRIAASLSGGDDSVFVTGPSFLRERLPRRAFSCHKGQAGRVAIVAGSSGLCGAARLCGLGALHGGAGLITVFVPEAIYPIVAASAAPELMIRPFRDYGEVRSFPADVLAVGPGLGREPADSPGLVDLLQRDPRPVVVDADALNLLSRNREVLSWFRPAGRRLLTPHPGEMARLLGEDKGKGPEADRLAIARQVVDRLPVTLLFKGARTLVAEKGWPVGINPSGNPGMATGGIGDVLTGLCAALLAQGLTPFDAAVMGSWLIGWSAERSVFSGRESPESLTASRVAGGLGEAFRAIRLGAV